MHEVVVMIVMSIRKQITLTAWFKTCRSARNAPSGSIHGCAVRQFHFISRFQHAVLVVFFVIIATLVTATKATTATTTMFVVVVIFIVKVDVLVKSFVESFFVFFLVGCKVTLPSQNSAVCDNIPLEPVPLRRLVIMRRRIGVVDDDDDESEICPRDGFLVDCTVRWARFLRAPRRRVNHRLSMQLSFVFGFGACKQLFFHILLLILILL